MCARGGGSNNVRAWCRHAGRWFLRPTPAHPTAPHRWCAPTGASARGASGRQPTRWRSTWTPCSRGPTSSRSVARRPGTRRMLHIDTRGQRAPSSSTFRHKRPPSRLRPIPALLTLRFHFFFQTERLRDGAAMPPAPALVHTHTQSLLHHVVLVPSG